MKKLFITFSLLLIFGCSQNNEIHDIDILSYNYLGDEFMRPHPQYCLYSHIDEYGIAKTLQKNEGRIAAYTSKIDTTLLNRIIAVTKNANANTFYPNRDRAKKVICDGTTLRIRVRYENGKEITFNITPSDTYSGNPIFKPFTTLHSQLLNDSLRAKPISLSVKKALINDEIEFEKYTIHQDTLLPPYPVKFKKVRYPYMPSSRQSRQP